MKFRSIAARICVLVIPTIAVTTLSFAAFSYYVSNSRINRTINEKMHESLQLADAKIQLELQKNATVAMNYASYGRMLRFETFDHVKHKQFLADAKAHSQNTCGGGVWFEPYGFDSRSRCFGPFLYEGENGELLYSPDYGDVDYFDEDWYIGGKESGGKLTWSKIYVDPVSLTNMVTATMPFFDDEGRLAGVATADMNIENIRAIVGGVTVGKTGRAMILDSGGEYISFLDGVRDGDSAMHTDEDAALKDLRKELTSGASGTTTFVRDGVRQRVYYTTMKPIGWILAVAVAEHEISSSAFTSFILMTIIPVVGLLLVILGIMMIINYLRRIIHKVNALADLAAGGDFSKRIDVTEIDEFGLMGQHLNLMISNMNDMSSHSAELLKIAENASNSKSDFLSRMSHEIRTPMNAIIGMTQIAKGSEDPVKVNDCLVKIDNASKHLLALINDILDMSKIEANKLDLAAEEFSLRQSLANVYNMMLVRADEKKQQLILNVDDSVPSYIIGDELRFAQVLTNLVGNAVKFTPENGIITIQAEAAEAGDATDNGDGSCVIQVSVRDSGIGLSPEQQSRLFKSFEQGDVSTSRKFGGTGLGLAISKRIVEMMGGAIGVTSVQGEGSTFTFTIKAQRSSGAVEIAKRQTEQLSPDDMKALRILVVDDSVEANEYLTHILDTFSLTCDNAYNGYDALFAVEKATVQNRPYNIIFMDYLMPELNGIEVTRRIRQMSNEGTAIIMVSIYDWELIEQEARDVGIMKHITKPFAPGAILELINEVAFGMMKQSFPKLNTSINDFDDNTILLAEDIEINREIVAAFLEPTKVRIDFAENGVQATEMFRAAPDKYDVILMDIQMPEMDGLEATRTIRRMDFPRAKTIPIIAMTANALSDDVKKCREAGMNDHLSKPLAPEALLLSLNNYFFMKSYLDHDIS